jgi:hypothetical protein
LRPFAKAGLVAVGYIAAGAIAWLVVSIYVAATSSPDRQGGMSAFGDSLLFLAVFGLAAVPATGAGLFFLRTRPVVWGTLSVVSVAVASTSIAACLTYLAPTASEPGSLLHSWSAFATLRILVAPLLALFFLLSGLFAPNRSARIALIAATTIELGVLACAAIGLVHPFHR